MAAGKAMADSRHSDGRKWRPAFITPSDGPYADVSVVMLILDRDGVPVGQARGRADRLGPGEGLDLETPLPAGGVAARVYELCWRADGERRTLGPHKQWQFGAVPA